MEFLCKTLAVKAYGWIGGAVLSRCSPAFPFERWGDPASKGHGIAPMNIFRRRTLKRG
jgi:hypothetical protein